MRVSVSLHKLEPDENANQSWREADYQNFNREYAEMEFDEAGNGLVTIKNMQFPECGGDDRERQVLTHFSIGVCEGPLGRGGSIINAGPLDAAIEIRPGYSPELRAAMVGVYRSRLDEMRADGRLFDHLPNCGRGT